MPDLEIPNKLNTWDLNSEHAEEIVICDTDQKIVRSDHRSGPRLMYIQSEIKMFFCNLSEDDKTREELFVASLTKKLIIFVPIKEAVGRTYSHKAR